MRAGELEFFLLCEVAEVEGPGGAFVQVYYDQAVLPPGPYDAGLRHYLGRRGRLRPDITMVAGAPGRASRAILIEVKLSTETTTREREDRHK